MGTENRSLWPTHAEALGQLGTLNVDVYAFFKEVSTVPKLPHKTPPEKVEAGNCILTLPGRELLPADSNCDRASALPIAHPWYLCPRGFDLQQLTSSTQILTIKIVRWQPSIKKESGKQQ